jgi:hypothetical protein
MSVFVGQGLTEIAEWKMRNKKWKTENVPGFLMGKVDRRPWAIAASTNAALKVLLSQALTELGK